MKNYLTFLLFLTVNICLQSQSSSCLRIFQEATSLAKKGDYQMALNKYNAARVCDQSLIAKVDRGLINLFKLIEGEKEEAIRQRKSAEEQKSIAEEQSSLAIERERIAKEAFLTADLATKNEEKARKEAEREKIIAIKNDSLAQLARIKSKHNELKAWANFYESRDARLSLKFNLEALDYEFSDEVVSSIRNIVSNPSSTFRIPFFESKDSLNKVWIIEGEQQIATIDIRGLFNLFNIQGESIQQISFDEKTNYNKILSIDVSISGKRIVTSHQNGEVFLWSISGELIRQIKTIPKEDKVYEISFSPDEKSILTVARNYSIIDEIELPSQFLSIIDLRDDKRYVIERFSYPLDYIVFKFHPKKKILYYTVNSNKHYKLIKKKHKNIYVCNYYGKKIKRIPLKNVKKDRNQIFFSDFDDQIWVQSYYGTLTLLEENGKIVREVFAEYTEKKNQKNLFYNDLNIITYTSNKIWYDIYPGERLIEFKGHKNNVEDVLLSRAMNLLVSYDVFSVNIWKLFDPRIERYEEITQLCFNEINQIREDEFGTSFICTNDTKYIITGGDPFDKSIFNFSEPYVLIYENVPPYELNNYFLAHENGIEEIIKSPNNNFIATRGIDTVKLWNLDGELLTTFIDSVANITSFGFNSSGSKITTVGTDGCLKIWDLQGNKLLCKKLHEAEINDFDFTENSKYYITGSNDKMAILWDGNGNPIDTFNHDNKIEYVDISENEELILIASKNEIRVFDFNGDYWQTISHDDIDNCQFLEDSRFIKVGSTIYKSWHEIIESSVRPFTEKELIEFQFLN